MFGCEIAIASPAPMIKGGRFQVNKWTCGIVFTHLYLSFQNCPYAIRPQLVCEMDNTTSNVFTSTVEHKV